MGQYGYRMSRCTDPSNAPQRLHWAILEDVKVEHELVTAILPHVPRVALPDVIGEVKAILHRITTCEAADPEDVRNLSRDHDLFEIRIQLRSFGLLIRIYTAEPPELPQHIVALHVHQKVVDLDREATAELQNHEIDVASRRLTEGRAVWWGLL